MSVHPFDPECITARILAQELRDMMALAEITPAELGEMVGISGEGVHAWLRGDNLKQPMRFMAAVDALGYDVVFRKRRAINR